MKAEKFFALRVTPPAKAPTWTRGTLFDCIFPAPWYNVRFLLGDLNMYAYELGSALRCCGIEFTYLAWHAERHASGDPNLHDSCVIGAIGGLVYPPKYMTFESHCIAAAMLPHRREAGNVRGYKAASYVGSQVI